MIDNNVARAACLVDSWCTSWGLEVRWPVKGEVADLYVAGRSVILGGMDDKTGDIHLDIAAVTALDSSVMIQEVRKIPKALGIKRKLPGPRAPNAAARADHEDYEGGILRLAQFARTGNPPDAIMKLYVPTVKNMARRYAIRYHRALSDMGETQDDLVVIAMVWFVNHYWRNADKRTGKLDKRLLINALKQNFSRWYLLTNRKLLNMELGVDGVPISEITGTPLPGGRVDKISRLEDGVFVNEGVYHPVEFVDIRGKSQDTEEPRQKGGGSRKAKLQLQEWLATAPHDSVVETLQSIIDSRFQNHDSKRLATSYLKRHRRDCSICMASSSQLKNDQVECELPANKH